MLCALRRPEEALAETDGLQHGTDTTPRWRGTLARTRAQALRSLGRTSEAQAALEAARQDLSTAGDPEAATHALLEALDLLVAEGRTADADHLLWNPRIIQSLERASRRSRLALYSPQLSAAHGILTLEEILEVTVAPWPPAGSDEETADGVH